MLLTLLLNACAAQGTKPEGMYFLTSGEVEVVKAVETGGDEEVLTTLRAGSSAC